MEASERQEGVEPQGKVEESVKLYCLNTSG